MKRRTRVTLVLTTTLLLLNTAIAQQIINDKPTPSRAEGAPLGYAYGRDYSTSDVTPGCRSRRWDTGRRHSSQQESPSQLSSTISLT